MRYFKLKLPMLITLSLLTFCCSTNTQKKYDIRTNTDIQKAQKTSNKPSKIEDPNIEYIPQWFIANQLNTDEVLYGFGSGKTSQQATQNALADMIQRLQVTVSTTTSFTNISNNNKVSQKLIQEVTTSSADVTIPNYQVINQSQTDNTFYIEIQINKSQTINDLKDLISSNIKQASQLLSTTYNKSSIYRFNIIQQVDKNIKIIKSSLRAVVVLSPSIDINEYMEALNHIDNELLNVKRTIQIYIDKQNSGFFYSSLEKYLQVNNYITTDNKNSANISISLKLKDYDNRLINNCYCINTTIELQITDNLSSQLAPKQYVVKYCSSKGRESAIDNAIEIFYSQLSNATKIY
ncbi:LPP20 lipofamily protein [Francisella philomiragia]|uniref:LPP20 family lipoprotein n=1 Tax=Francisella philomiragia TaxID=28110 RepID=UPI0005A57BC6|nr:LPP20 family lipoprotein [Francisella philomiragia]AJI56561.1 LPP20 lipofamily protein [Francisella philomiragia]